jgi:competence ComEA-like helix-hairpin-helix protein
LSILTRIQSKTSTTRGEITVALFLASAALAGFVYVTFFETRTTLGQQHDLLRLMRRYDSTVAARKQGQHAALDSSLAGTDSLPPLVPLADADAVADSLAESHPASSSKKTAPTAPVDINSASKAALMQLPGVGEKTAETIIEYRSHVPFRRAEDIMNVKGIGEKKFERMKPYIVVK